MSPILIAIIVVLCQYPVAMLTLMKMFRCKLGKAESITWNFIIVFLPFVGALSFWICYAIAQKKIKQNIENQSKNPPLTIGSGEGETADDGSEGDVEKSAKSPRAKTRKMRQKKNKGVSMPQ